MKKHFFLLVAILTRFGYGEAPNRYELARDAFNNASRLTLASLKIGNELAANVHCVGNRVPMYKTRFLIKKTRDNLLGDYTFVSMPKVAGIELLATLVEEGGDLVGIGPFRLIIRTTTAPSGHKFLLFSFSHDTKSGYCWVPEK